MDSNLHVHFIGDRQAAVDGRRRGAPVFVQFQTHGPGGDLFEGLAIHNLLRSAVEAVADDHGWAFLGAVGTQIANRASFDSRNYGYRKLSDLVVASGLFEIRRQELAIHLRDKRHPEARGTRAGATAAE